MAFHLHAGNIPSAPLSSIFTDKKHDNQLTSFFFYTNSHIVWRLKNFKRFMEKSCCCSLAMHGIANPAFDKLIKGKVLDG
jgi:hypothetical protein